RLLGVELEPAHAATTRLALLLADPTTLVSYTLAAGAAAQAATGSPPPALASNYLTVVWDGKSPKLKDLPLGPVVLAPASTQRYLWVGVNYNSALDAGFRAVQVTLTVQFDDDEQPSFTATCDGGPQQPPG